MKYKCNTSVLNAAVAVCLTTERNTFDTLPFVLLCFVSDVEPREIITSATQFLEKRNPTKHLIYFLEVRQLCCMAILAIYFAIVKNIFFYHDTGLFTLQFKHLDMHLNTVTLQFQSVLIGSTCYALHPTLTSKVHPWEAELLFKLPPVTNRHQRRETLHKVKVLPGCDYHSNGKHRLIMLLNLWTHSDIKSLIKECVTGSVAVLTSESHFLSAGEAAVLFLVFVGGLVVIGRRRRRRFALRLWKTKHLKFNSWNSK